MSDEDREEWGRVLSKKPGKDTDMAVARLVFGWTEIDPVTGCGYPPGRVCPPGGRAEPAGWPPRLGTSKVPEYSTDMNAAWLVVAEMARRDYRLRLNAPGSFSGEGLGGADPAEDCWSASFEIPATESDPEAMRHPHYRLGGFMGGSTAAFAVCRSALDAVIKARGCSAIAGGP